MCLGVSLSQTGQTSGNIRRPVHKPAKLPGRRSEAELPNGQDSVCVFADQETHASEEQDRGQMLWKPLEQETP